MNINCTLCGTKSTLYSKKQHKRYYACPLCQGIFMHPDDYLTKEAEKSRYEMHHNDVLDLGYQGFVGPIVDAVSQLFTSNSIGLDYGCGTGPVISKMLMDKDYVIKLYDPFFANQYENLQRQYDYIVCCEVMEHFHHPSDEFNKLKRLLKPNGMLIMKTSLYHETIDFENWYYKNDPTHVFFYRKSTLEWILKHYHFKSLIITEQYLRFMI